MQSASWTIGRKLTELLKRALISIGALAVGYLVGLAVWAVVGTRLFAFGFFFQALAYLLFTFTGWLLLLVPQVVLGLWGRFFGTVKRSTVSGGLGGVFIVAIFLVFGSPMGRPFDSTWVAAFRLFGVCAFITGSIAAGLYVALLKRL